MASRPTKSQLIQFLASVLGREPDPTQTWKQLAEQVRKETGPHWMKEVRSRLQREDLQRLRQEKLERQRRKFYEARRRVKGDPTLDTEIEQAFEQDPKLARMDEKQLRAEAKKRYKGKPRQQARFIQRGKLLAAHRLSFEDQAKKLAKDPKLQAEADREIIRRLAQSKTRSVEDAQALIGELRPDVTGAQRDLERMPRRRKDLVDELSIALLARAGGERVSDLPDNIEPIDFVNLEKYRGGTEQNIAGPREFTPRSSTGDDNPDQALVQGGPGESDARQALQAEVDAPIDQVLSEGDEFGEHRKPSSLTEQQVAFRTAYLNGELESWFDNIAEGIEDPQARRRFQRRVDLAFKKAQRESGKSGMPYALQTLYNEVLAEQGAPGIRRDGTAAESASGLPDLWEEAASDRGRPSRRGPTPYTGDADVDRRIHDILARENAFTARHEDLPASGRKKPRFLESPTYPYGSLRERLQRSFNNPQSQAETLTHGGSALAYQRWEAKDYRKQETQARDIENVEALQANTPDEPADLDDRIEQLGAREIDRQATDKVADSWLNDRAEEFDKNVERWKELDVPPDDPDVRKALETPGYNPYRDPKTQQATREAAWILTRPAPQGPPTGFLADQDPWYTTTMVRDEFVDSTGQVRRQYEPKTTLTEAGRQGLARLEGLDANRLNADHMGDVYDARVYSWFFRGDGLGENMSRMGQGLEQYIEENSPGWLDQKKGRQKYTPRQKLEMITDRDMRRAMALEGLDLNEAELQQLRRRIYYANLAAWASFEGPDDVTSMRVYQKLDADGNVVETIPAAMSGLSPDSKSVNAPKGFRSATVNLRDSIPVTEGPNQGMKTGRLEGAEQSLRNILIPAAYRDVSQKSPSITTRQQRLDKTMQALDQEARQYLVNRRKADEAVRRQVDEEVATFYTEPAHPSTQPQWEQYDEARKKELLRTYQEDLKRHKRTLRQRADDILAEEGLTRRAAYLQENDLMPAYAGPEDWDAYVDAVAGVDKSGKMDPDKELRRGAAEASEGLDVPPPIREQQMATTRSINPANARAFGFTAADAADVSSWISQQAPGAAFYTIRSQTAEGKPVYFVLTDDMDAEAAIQSFADQKNKPLRSIPTEEAKRLAEVENSKITARPDPDTTPARKVDLAPAGATNRPYKGFEPPSQYNQGMGDVTGPASAGGAGAVVLGSDLSDMEMYNPRPQGATPEGEMAAPAQATPTQATPTQAAPAGKTPQQAAQALLEAIEEPGFSKGSVTADVFQDVEAVARGELDLNKANPQAKALIGQYGAVMDLPPDQRGKALVQAGMDAEANQTASPDGDVDGKPKTTDTDTDGPPRKRRWLTGKRAIAAGVGTALGLALLTKMNEWGAESKRVDTVGKGLLAMKLMESQMQGGMNENEALASALSGDTDVLRRMAFSMYNPANISYEPPAEELAARQRLIMNQMRMAQMQQKLTPNEFMVGGNR